MKNLFSDLLVIAVSIFGTLIVTPSFKKFFNRKAYFSNINGEKIIRIIVSFAYIALAVYMNYKVKNTPNEMTYLILYIILGAVLSCISYRLSKLSPPKEKRVQK